MQSRLRRAAYLPSRRGLLRTRFHYAYSTVSGRRSSFGEEYEIVGGVAVALAIGFRGVLPAADFCELANVVSRLRIGVMLRHDGDDFSDFTII